VERRVVEKVLAVLATVIVGGMIAYQPPVNALLADKTSAIGAAFISLVTSTVLLGTLAVITGHAGEITKVPSLPPGYLFGGVGGAFIVSVSLVTVKPLGAGGVVAATVSSQLIVSALLDRAGAVGLEQVGLTPMRLTGFALLLIGTVLVTAAR
jgi:transporter family-2 protein